MRTGSVSVFHSKKWRVIRIGTDIDAAYLADAETGEIHPPALGEENDAGPEDQEEEATGIKKSPPAILVTWRYYRTILFSFPMLASKAVVVY